jgi:hypothetical protein
MQSRDKIRLFLLLATLPRDERVRNWASRRHLYDQHIGKSMVARFDPFLSATFASLATACKNDARTKNVRIPKFLPRQTVCQKGIKSYPLVPAAWHKRVESVQHACRAISRRLRLLTAADRKQFGAPEGWSPTIGLSPMYSLISLYKE